MTSLDVRNGKVYVSKEMLSDDNKADEIQEKICKFFGCKWEDLQCDYDWEREIHIISDK